MTRTGENNTALVVKNISQLLENASRCQSGLTFYGKSSSEPIHALYADFQQDATEKAHLLRDFWTSASASASGSSIVLLHFDTQSEAVLWFWAVTLAGLIPCMSTPFVVDEGKRKKHILHLQALLDKPLILTSERLLPEFRGVEGLALHSVESLGDKRPTNPAMNLPGPLKDPEQTALLMLTSGSTGNAKAVPLRHGQILAALRGKASHYGSRPDDVFLNWVGLDHVASMTEVHLLAVSLGSEQVHIPAGKLSQNPLRFIELLETHRVTSTFAPNFFLTKLRDALAANPKVTADLSALRRINSGGEANVVATCAALTRQLQQRCRTPSDLEVISPGFGMTETCAGAIHCTGGFPSVDAKRGLEFARLGTCIPGVQMRVVGKNNQHAVCGETGELQLKGPVIFTGYYNDPVATAQAFTEDGWFITGDLAWIDDSGSLNLAGRIKDIIIINGVNWSATEIETAIEEEGIPGVTPSWTVVFPYRDPGSPTEGVAVVYVPAFGEDEAAVRFETDAAITKIVALLTAQKPGHIIPLPAEMLEKSLLGKVSRTKVRKAFVSGVYASIEERHLAAVNAYRQSTWKQCATETERKIQVVLSEILQIPVEKISADSLPWTYPYQPSVKSPPQSTPPALHPPAYNPIVPLQVHGTQIPLFLIHPGSGDILVFIALAAQFPNRPVYAIRTRGYNANEPLFPTMQSTVETYTSHIRKVQPHGPYAIAGYSLGSTLAFEVGKLLESQGQEVRFLASIDYPPHIRQYVSGQNWQDVVLHISFFLELIGDELMNSAKAYFLSPQISDIGENFRVHGESYEPVGSVDHLDVFIADPPGYAALDRRDWVENKLGGWRDFARTDVEFHECPGIHARMLNPDHILEFVKSFKAAMKMRGV
ncbi:acetyl-CoA synthetase-like protein [Penicillium verrucosum]|uniref:acetyl-CoA synthetase-like protein n=1 Tax=Penicillium verrucosum TaxID=60171 RepID=UPI0025457528|nr:acetyl-CoA synthetase-like protein [Penicillium verrucosum]KAJ5933079.1 acetyl-CoA synthetase-like protein [Penicillium verrucosum]